MWLKEQALNRTYFICSECGAGNKYANLFNFCPQCGAVNRGIGRKKKNIIYISDGYYDGLPVYDEAECPNCSKHFEEYGEAWKCNFCPDCGQALNWDFEEENTDHIKN